MERFVREAWGGRLIRGWYEGWLEWPEEIGDRLGRVALGAAPGQVVVADSTSVMLYKLARAAVAARPERREIVLDSGDFPTDRYVLEGIAAERGLELRFLETPLDGGVTAEQIAAVAGPATALVALSHVNYRSAHIADAAAITAVAHDAGALVLWDLSHAAGVVEVALDDWGADLAVGCTYKYLNGGPGSPAFGYVRAAHHSALRQPIQGWIGRRDPFTMGPGTSPPTACGASSAARRPCSRWSRSRAASTSSRRPASRRSGRSRSRSATTRSSWPTRCSRRTASASPRRGTARGAAAM